MRYLLAVLAGLGAAAAGWLVTGALAAWIAGLLGVSDFEGQRGMFAFLVVGPLGGLVAMVLAVWLVLRRGRGGVSTGRTLARVAAALAGIAALAAAAVGVRLCTIDTYTDTAPPTLEFELRVPAGSVPPRAAVRVELHTDRNVGDGPLAEPTPPTADGHQVIAGSVPLAFKTRSRLLVVTLGDQPTRLFPLGLGRDPAATPVFGAWQRAQHVDRGAGGVVAAPPDDPVELRFRVRRADAE